MSTLHNTAVRLAGWVRRHALVLIAGVAVLGLVVAIFVGTFRVYDERQARLTAIEALAAENAEQDRQQCEDLNGSNATIRFILDGILRARPDGAPPIPEATRQLYIDTYRRLPHTDCTTGVRTDFAPPFPAPPFPN